MQNLQSETAVNTPPRRWPLFLAGVLLFLLGHVIYFVQTNYFGFMKMPWHVLALASAGVLLMAVSVLQRGGIWRSAGLGLFVLLCGLEWYFMLVFTKTPPYEGPAQPGQKVPAFAANYADGSEFTHKNLEDGKRTILLFYRGHW